MWNQSFLILTIWALRLRIHSILPGSISLLNFGKLLQNSTVTFFSNLILELLEFFLIFEPIFEIVPSLHSFKETDHSILCRGIVSYNYFIQDVEFFQFLDMLPENVGLVITFVVGLMFLQKCNLKKLPPNFTEGLKFINFILRYEIVRVCWQLLFQLNGLLDRQWAAASPRKVMSSMFSSNNNSIGLPLGVQSFFPFNKYIFFWVKQIFCKMCEIREVLIILIKI